MNGGLEHALEYLSHEDLHGAVAGFRYFNLDKVASLLEAAMACDGDESRLDVLEARYGDLVPSDNVLVTAFEELYTSSPSAFAPSYPSCPQCCLTIGSSDRRGAASVGQGEGR